MKLRPENLRRLPRTAYAFKRNFRIQQQFNRRFLDPYREWPNNDGSLEKKDQRRMWDYAIQFVVFFADFFNQLRGYPMEELERERITTYAALLCLYDDFFDENSLSTEEIWALYQEPEKFKARNSKEEVCQALLTHLFKIYPRNEHFDEVFQQFHQAQKESKLQYKGHERSRDWIRQSSFHKGGYALLLSRLLLDHPPKEGEEEAVYELGAWFQILDDIVDIAKDRREEIATLVTTSPSVETIEAELIQQTQKAFQAIRDLDYPFELKEKTVFSYHIMGTMPWVHLGRLKKLQDAGHFELFKYPESDIEWVEARSSNYFIGLGLMLGKEF